MIRKIRKYQHWHYFLSHLNDTLKVINKKNQNNFNRTQLTLSTETLTSFIQKLDLKGIKQHLYLSYSCFYFKQILDNVSLLTLNVGTKSFQTFINLHHINNACQPIFVYVGMIYLIHVYVEKICNYLMLTYTKGFMLVRLLNF